MKGVDAIDAPPGLTAPWVTWCLDRIARELHERAEAEDEEEETVTPGNAPEDEAAPWQINEEEPSPHPIVFRRSLAGGYLTREEVRDVLLDAYRPLATFLKSFGDWSLEDDPVEATERLRAALPVARKSAAGAWSMHSLGVAREPIGIDWIGHTDLLVVVAYAIEGVTGHDNLTMRGVGSVASAIEGTVRHVYEALVETEEVAHV